MPGSAFRTVPICGREIEPADGGSDGGPGAGAAGGNPDPDPGAGGARQRKGEHAKEFESARRSGYVRVRVDGNLYDLSEEIKLEKNKKHTIEIVVDRLVVKEEIRSRLADSLETALGLTGAIAVVNVIGGEDITFSQQYACPDHGVSIEELTPRMFSFNNPAGACPKCTGLGTFMKIDPDLVIPNKELSIRQGAIKASGWYYAEGGMAQMYYEGLARALRLLAGYPDQGSAQEGSGHPALRHQRRRKADHAAGKPAP